MKKSLLSFLFAILFCTILVNEVFAQWMLISGPSGGGYLRCTDFLKVGTNLFAGTQGGGVFVTTDNGTSWNAINDGLSDKNVISLLKSNTKLFAVTEGGLFMISYNGANWAVSNNGLTNSVFALASSGSNLFAGSQNGIFISTDEGDSWNLTGLSNRMVRTLAFADSKVYAGAFAYFDESGVFVSTDEGSNWLKINNDIPDTSVNSIVVESSNIYASVVSGVYASTNGGQNWYDANSGLPSSAVIFALNGSNVFAGTYGNGVFLSTNKGLNWINVNDSYNNKFINSLNVIDGDVYAGTYDGGLYKRALSEMITAVDAVENIPYAYFLLQNYPNPFNPSTKISWQSPVSGHQKLKVFDVLGNEVATLVDQYKEAGRYEISFDASQLSSGIYFYKLQVGNFVDTKKMIFMK